MYPEVQRRGEILLPEEVSSKYQPDWGVVARVHPHDTRNWGLEPGHIVAVEPYKGVWYSHLDFAWIPKDRLVKILGTVDHWMQNIVVVREMAVAA